ncbi:MAG: YggT family protein [Stagnimonas sp.]|nr:YggT family protein [Stagnimonas sp.]
MDLSHDQRLAAEEARRLQQHTALRGELDADLDRRITAEARDTPQADVGIGAVAADLRGKALREVVSTEREMAALRTAARINQFVDYLFYLLYALLSLRFLLALMAASNHAGFVRFVKAVTEPFYLPFKGIVVSPGLDNGVTLALPLLFAILVYFLLHLALRGLLRLIAARRNQL